MGTFTQVLLLSLAFCSGSKALPATPVASADAPITTVFNFDPLSLPENIAQRNNGQLLVTCLTCSHLSQIDPNQGPDQLRRVVHTFDDGLAVTGIAELQQDVFAVNVGPGLSLPGGKPGPGLNSIYTVDLKGYQAPDYDANKVIVRKVASGGSAILIDAIAVINATRGLLAGTDIIGGALYLIDIKEGTSRILANDALTLGRGGQPSTLPVNFTSTLTANGIKFHDSKVYFTNTILGLLGYLPVDSSTGNPTGRITTVQTYITDGLMLDDFNFAQSGNIYLTTFSTPVGGGLYRRIAGTNGGQNTQQVVSRFGTNAVIPIDNRKGNCDLIFSCVLTAQVLRTTVPGHC